MHDLGAIDLNLLPILDSLLTTTSVSESARQLGKTQSGISHALGRLRDVFEDPLLVRTGNQMARTPVAQSLCEPARQAVTQLRSVLAMRRFEPATAERSFRIGAADYAGLLVIPSLVEKLRKSAPGLSLIVQTSGDKVDARVRDGDLDLAIGASYRPLAGIFRRVLAKDDFVVVTRRGHPASTKRLTLSRYCAFDHAVVSPRGLPSGIVDRALAAKGQRRRVSFVSPSFLLAMATIARTDLLCTIPSRLAGAIGDSFALQVQKTPAELSLEPVELVMVFGEVHRDDIAHRWLREQIIETIQASAATH